MAVPDDLINCIRCPRLAEHQRTLPPRRGLTRSDYWNRPVSGFGDPLARICIVGLAPGAHGANRTGRPFTGDGAGDFMYPLLHRAGLTSQAEATHAGDGLRLHDLYITNAVKCLPPDNRPQPPEFAACRPWLTADLASLPHLRVIVALGQGAFTSVLRLFQEQGKIRRLADFPFAHQASYLIPAGPILMASYHTSRYNIQTRRLTEAMFDSLLNQVLTLAAGENG